MINMVGRYAGVLLVSVVGKYILQRRENRAGVSNRGKITTFGGMCEEGERFEAAAIREIREELDYSLHGGSLAFLCNLMKTEDTGTATACRFFLYQDPVSPDDLTLLEGEKIEHLHYREAICNAGLSEVCAQVLQAHQRKGK